MKIKSSELYKQIYDLVLAKIDRKEWKEHEKLPSVRRMAEELNVNRLTVLRAYQLLKEHKKIYAKEKSGYFVQPEDPSFSLNESQLPEIADYPYSNLLSSIHQVAVDYQFSQALIDPNLLPNSYLSEYVKKVFTLYPKVLGTYSTVQGDEELRTALSDYFYKTHHFFAPIDELLITSGAQQAIDLVAKVLLRANDTVLVERPTYSSAIDIFRQYGARIIGIEIGQGGYDLNQLEHILKKINRGFSIQIQPSIIQQATPFLLCKENSWWNLQKSINVSSLKMILSGIFILIRLLHSRFIRMIPMAMLSISAALVNTFHLDCVLQL